MNRSPQSSPGARRARPALRAAAVAAGACVAWAACAAPVRPDPAAWFAAADLRAFASVTTPHGVLVAGGRVAERGVVALFTPAGARTATVELGDDVVYAVAASDDGAHAAAALADGNVVLLPLPALAPAVPLWRHGRAAVAVAFSPVVVARDTFSPATGGGPWLASAGLDGVVRTGPIGPIAAAVAGAAAGSPAGAMPAAVVLLEHTAAATCVAWSADGALVVSGARDGKVRVHERTGRLLETWQRLGGDVREVTFTAGGVWCRVQPSPLAAPQEHVLPFAAPATARSRSRP